MCVCAHPHGVAGVAGAMAQRSTHTGAAAGTRTRIRAGGLLALLLALSACVGVRGQGGTTQAAADLFGPEATPTAAPRDVGRREANATAVNATAATVAATTAAAGACTCSAACPGACVPPGQGDETTAAGGTDQGDAASTTTRGAGVILETSAAEINKRLVRCAGCPAPSPALSLGLPNTHARTHTRTTPCGGGGRPGQITHVPQPD